MEAPQEKGSSGGAGTSSWADLPGPALELVLEGLTLRDRLTAECACKPWLEGSRSSARLWGTLALDGGDFSEAAGAALVDKVAASAAAWFARRSRVLKRLRIESWEVEETQRLARLVAPALKGAGPVLSELVLCLETEPSQAIVPLDTCPTVLAACTRLQRLELQTCSASVMAALPPSLTWLSLRYSLRADVSAQIDDPLEFLNRTFGPLTRLTSLAQLNFSTNMALGAAVPAHFGPPQLRALTVRQPNLYALSPAISKMSRLEQLDLINELRWGDGEEAEQEAHGGGQGAEEAGEDEENRGDGDGDGEQEERGAQLEPEAAEVAGAQDAAAGQQLPAAAGGGGAGDGNGGQLIYHFQLPPVLAGTPIRRLRFYNALFVEFPQAVTGMAALEELVFRNSKLGRFAEQDIDLSGLSSLTALRFAGCTLPHAPASLASLPALKSLVFEACPVPGSTFGLFGLGGQALTLAPELSQLTQLESLEFYGCRLTVLPGAIAGMQGLRRLVLAGTSVETYTNFHIMTGAASQLDVPPMLLSGLSQLQEVVFEQAYLKESSLVLHLPPSTKRVAVRCLQKGLECVDFGPRATGLEAVDLSGTPLAVVPPCLASSAASLRVVYLTSSDKEHPFTQEDVAAVAPSARLSPRNGGWEAFGAKHDADLGPPSAFFAEPEEDQDGCAIM